MMRARPRVREGLALGQAETGNSLLKIENKQTQTIATNDRLESTAVIGLARKLQNLRCFSTGERSRYYIDCEDKLLYGKGKM